GGLRGAAVGLAAIAGGTTAMEYWTQMRLWSGKGDKDVVIVLDGSMSMSLARGKGSSFTQALEEARAVIGDCEAGDAIGIILAGGTPRAVTSGVISDRDRLADHLKKLKPTEGTMQPHEAIRAAAGMLEGGPHPRKWIVVITDGQNVGWDFKNENAWQTTAAQLTALAKGKNLAAPPRVICRTLPRVQLPMNLAVADVQTSRRVVGTDRPVRIDVKVSNTAAEPGPPGEVKLAIDGAAAGAEAYSETGPGESATVAFHHTFAQPGVHVIAASIDSKDALPGDNEAVRTITVVEEIPVLIVDGSPRIGEGAGGVRFLEKALAPGAGGRKYLVRPEVMRDDRFDPASLSRYAVVILSDVAELSADQARALAGWVEAGGGLLIAPGRSARPEFYNAWRTRTGEPVSAARMQRRLSVAGQPARLAPTTFTHPALEILLDPQAEPDKVLVMSYWQMSPEVLADPPARTGGALDSTDPLLVERPVGQGRVLQLALALDNVDSTLYKPAHLPPLAHELVYYLSAPTAEEANVPPGARVAVRLRARAADKAAARKTPAPGRVEVVGPGDVRLEGTLEYPASPNTPVLVFAGAGGPGLEAAALAVVKGSVLGGDDGDLHKTERDDEEPAGIETLVLAERDEGRVQGVRAGGEKGKAIAEAMNWARDRVNEPGNVLTPRELADRAQAMAGEWNLDITVHDEQSLEAMGANALLAVALGSAEPARLVVIRRPGPGPLVAFVGKGIT
ncbi:MAG: VWA domain-containing protein, partial [Planctomycetota bacterium]|nr:VWA domain-containing protein [Planctomycetota bacterium]